MSVLDRNVVDFGHEDDDKVTVCISDHIPWDSEILKAHLEVLQDKVNDYLDYIASGQIYEDLECLEDYEDECEIRFSTPEEFANALKGRMKYIFVNQNGSYTIGYDDGYVFGGHEIDVDVDSKGKMVCADMR